MAKLTAETRNKLPGKSFAGPERSYPIEDKSHARNALARVSQHGSPALQKRVRAAVHRKYPGIGKRAEGGDVKPKRIIDPMASIRRDNEAAIARLKPAYGAGVGYIQTDSSISDKPTGRAKGGPVEGSAEDERIDKREAKKRGISMKQWERSPADRAMDARRNRKEGRAPTYPSAANSYVR